MGNSTDDSKVETPEEEGNDPTDSSDTPTGSGSTNGGNSGDILRFILKVIDTILHHFLLNEKKEDSTSDPPKDLSESKLPDKDSKEDV